MCGLKSPAAHRALFALDMGWNSWCSHLHNRLHERLSFKTLLTGTVMLLRRSGPRRTSAPILLSIMNSEACFRLMFCLVEPTLLLPLLLLLPCQQATGPMAVAAYRSSKNPLLSEGLRRSSVCTRRRLFFASMLCLYSSLTTGWVCARSGIHAYFFWIGHWPHVCEGRDGREARRLKQNR